MQQMYSCPNCGAPVAFRVKSCGNCGTELNWLNQRQMQPPLSYQQQQTQQPMQLDEIHSCKLCKYGPNFMRCLMGQTGSPISLKSLKSSNLEINLLRPSSLQTRYRLFNPNQMFCFEPKSISAEERLPETEEPAKERMPILPPWAEEPGRGRYRKELLLVILVIVAIITATYILFVLLS